MNIETNVIIWKNSGPSGALSVHVLNVDGTNTFTYTATSSEIFIQIRQAGTYYLDNIRMYRTYEDTMFVSGYEVDRGYRYGFSGHEKIDEVKGKGNSVNYKYRMHDPRIGRFFAVDPLAPKYPWYSPYQFSGNKLIHAVELEGLEEVELNSGEKIETGPRSIESTIDLLESMGTWDNGQYVTEWGDGAIGLEEIEVRAQHKEPSSSIIGKGSEQINNESGGLGESSSLITPLIGVGLGGYSAYNVSDGMFRGASGNYYSHVGRKGWNQYTGTKAQMNSTLSKAKWASRGAMGLGVVNYSTIINQRQEIGDVTFCIEMISNTIGTFTPPIISIPWTVGYEGLGKNGIARIPWYQNTFKPWIRQKMGLDE